MADPSDYLGISKPDQGKDPWTQDYYDFVDEVDQQVKEQEFQESASYFVSQRGGETYIMDGVNGAETFFGTVDEVLGWLQANTEDGQRIVFHGVSGEITTARTWTTDLYLDFYDSYFLQKQKEYSFNFEGENVARYDVQSDVEQWARYIDVPDGSVWSEGDLAFLQSDREFFTNVSSANPLGEVHEVLEVNGDSIQLADTVRYYYPLSQNPTVDRVDPVTVVIDGIEIEGDEAEGANADYKLLQFSYARDCVLRDSEVYRGKRGMSILGSYGTVVRNNKIYSFRGGSSGGVGYAVPVDHGNSYVWVEGNKIYDSRHCTKMGGSRRNVIPGYPWDIFWVNNYISGNDQSHVCDAHGVTGSKYLIDNVIDGGDRRAIASGAHITVVRGNRITASQEHPYLDRGDETESILIFEDNMVLGNGGPMVRLDSNDFDLVAIRDNSTEDPASLDSTSVGSGATVKDLIEERNIGINYGL
jgi:hypothetical protein